MLSAGLESVRICSTIIFAITGDRHLFDVRMALSGGIFIVVLIFQRFATIHSSSQCVDARRFDIAFNKH